MTDYASHTAALLCELRRERNGAAADAMSFRGRACGLNMGVAIPTVRSVAASFARDHAFAVYLYGEDVRELRIAALWLADAEAVSAQELDFWAAGIINSEIAEQAAMSLLAHVSCADVLLRKWCAADELLSYAAMMSAARNERASVDVVLSSVREALERFPDSRLAGQGATAAVMKIFAREPQTAKAFVASLEVSGAAANYLREEAAWRMDF